MTEEAPVNPVIRPMLLTVLCILTFIGGGLNIISGLAIGAFFPYFVRFGTFAAETYKIPGLEIITEGTPGFFFLSAVVYAGSVAGALLMWKLRKAGFHVYTISQILLLIAPMYFFRLPGPALADIILTGLFVILYGANLKFMT